MPTESITDEIRQIRRDLAARFGNDLDAILADIRMREASDGRTYVSLPPRVIFRNPDELGVRHGAANNPDTNE